MRFSLNTVCLFPGRSFEEIFPQMKERGFDTFELWSLDGIDLAALKAQKDRFGMRLSACCPSFFILNTLIPVNFLLFFSICANGLCVTTTIFRVEEA